MKRISSRRALNSQTPSTSKVWPIDHREDYRSFLKHCTLTNKAVGTIWRVLSKPPQGIQGPDPLPLWLLVGTPLVLWPELASRQAEHSHSCGCLYFWNTVFITLHVCVIILMASPLVLGLYKEDYLQFLKCVSFWFQGFCG